MLKMVSTTIRNQEKGVLAKGVSAESSVTPEILGPKKQKMPKKTGLSSTFAHSERHRQKRRKCLQKAPSKDPLFLVPDTNTLLSDLHLQSGVAPANQTKERSVSWTFHRGIPEQKFNVNRACFPKEKHRIHKNGRTSWTFRFGPLFGLVCWRDSWCKGKILFW